MVNERSVNAFKLISNMSCFYISEHIKVFSLVSRRHTHTHAHTERERRERERAGMRPGSKI